MKRLMEFVTYHDLVLGYCALCLTAIIVLLAVGHG